MVPRFVLGFTLAVFVMGRPTTAHAQPMVAMVSGSHEVYTRMVDGLREGCPSGLTVVNLSEGGEPVEDALRRVRAGDAIGVAALGTNACRLAVERVPPSVPVVLCTYGASVAGGGEAGRVAVSAVTDLGAHLSVVRRLVPAARRIAVLHRDEAAGVTDEASVAAGGVEGFSVRRFHLADWSELRARTEEAVAWGDVVWLPADPELTSTALAFMLKAALGARKPVFASSSRIVRGGALAGLEPDPAALGTAAARWLAGRGRGLLSPPSPVLWFNGRVAAFLGVGEPGGMGNVKVEIIR